MSAFTTEERLALLFNVLGDEVASPALQAMNPTRANYVRQLLNDFKIDPPSSEEVEYVIGDFNQFFQFAMKTLGPSLAQQKESSKDNKAQAASKAKTKITYFEKITPGNDPVADLKRLDPFQVASAIGDDHPKTIAMVLRHMETELAAKVLEFLDTPTRMETIVFLSQESTVPSAIVNQVLKTTVLKAISIEFREEAVDQSKVLAELLRSLSKDMRTELMAKLDQESPDLAGKVKDNLYLFEDVLRISDRDVQKLLAEIESDSLIVALQRTDQEIIDKLLNNLSKRARESIVEEMEYKKDVSEKEIEEARSDLVFALARLDERGDIKLQ